MCTEKYGAGSTWCSACHALRKFKSTWHTHILCHVRTSPYQSVLHCPHPVHCAMCSASQKCHVLLNFRGGLAVWSVGRQSALRGADTVSKECRTGRTGRTCRTIGTWCSECHVLRKFKSTWHTHILCHVRTSPYQSVPVRITLLPPCALRYALCQPVGMCS